LLTEYRVEEALVAKLKSLFPQEESIKESKES